MPRPQKSSTPNLKIDISLHPKQSQVFQTKANEILYGGAAGGGKSYLERVIAIAYATQVQGLNVYIFRRNYNDLIKNHMEGPTGFRALLSGWVEAGYVDIVKEEIRFTWNNSRIFLCHLNHPSDIYKYQGAEIHVLLIDEATQFSEDMIRFLRTRCRSANLKIPDGVKVPLIVYTANPGGVGHDYFRDNFVVAAPEGQVHRASNEQGGMQRVFIKALLEDNPSLMQEDPDYEFRLKGLGNAELIKAFRYGDWNAVSGAYFDRFNSDTHICHPFDIPFEYSRFGAFDWGSADPYCHLWFAVADGSVPNHPAGQLIVYRELYGGYRGKGLKQDVEQIGDAIKSMESAREELAYRVAGRDLWHERSGPSLAEHLARRGLQFQPATTDRASGWQEVLRRLNVDDLGRPGIVIFSTCSNLIRTLPSLMHDPRKPEDLIGADDHAADALRYGVMSRPVVRAKKLDEKPPPLIQVMQEELARRRDPRRRRYG